MLCMRGNAAESNTILKNLVLQALGTIWFRFLKKKYEKISCLCTFKRMLSVLLKGRVYA